MRVAVAGGTGVVGQHAVENLEKAGHEAVVLARSRGVDVATGDGVRHFVAISIVGIDRVDFGYYRGKVVQEELLLAADRPSSVLRATQFHEFAGQMLDRSRGPLAVVPRMLVQPIAAREVGEALAELAVGE